MPFSAEDGITVVGDRSDFESDAVPFADENVIQQERETNVCDPVDRNRGVPPDVINKTLSEDSEDDGLPVDCDRLIKDAMSVDPGLFKVENTALEINNSSSVHVGNSVTQNTKIAFERVTSVVVDRSQQFNIYCLEPTEKNENRLAIVNKFQEFIRRRYIDRLAYFTPLSWCAWFSPHLETLYTALKLFRSDLFDDRANHAAVTLEQIVQDKQSEFPNGSRPCRVLIQGNPGYGKTTLTLKMASDWATGKEYLNKFHLVFLITLRDFQGDLKSYVLKEFCAQHESQEDQEIWWSHIKEEENMLFILDGLDELAPEHKEPIYALLRGNIFDKVRIVVTSRCVPSDDRILSVFNRRIEVRGFGAEQTEQFIQNYFKFKQKHQDGSKLISLLNGPYSSSHHLSSCPLTCLFLCVVFEEMGDEGILQKVTQIYQALVQWLVHRASTKTRISGSPGVSVAPMSLHIREQQYQKALADFGLPCLKVLARGATQLTHEDLEEIPEMSCELVIELGLITRNWASRTAALSIPKKTTYEPIHKTFLEYLAALYLSGSIEDRFFDNLKYLQSSSISRECLKLIFKFLAGLLGDNASTFFRLYHLSTFELPAFTLFEMLHESGATKENVRSLSSILDSEVVMVRSNRIELDGWAGLLAEPDCPIRLLKFVWADTPLNGAALDRFFTAFQINRSVVCLVITAAVGLEPDENDVVAMGAFTVQALRKIQLRHFSLHLVGDTWATKVTTAVNNLLTYRDIASSLSSIKISVSVGTKDVVALSQGLRQSSVKSLALTKLSCEPEGYAAIASLVKSLEHLSVSLNLFKSLPPSEGDRRHEEGSPEDFQAMESYFNTVARQIAGISAQESLERSRSIDFTSSYESTRQGDTITHNELNMLASILSVQDCNNQIHFNLHDGLRFPGLVAPNAIGLLKPHEPVCQTDKHKSGFHSLFMALQEPDCTLSRLDLTGCYLGRLDLNCLGQAIRNSPSLKYLRMEKLKSFEEVFPILINTSLTWLDVTSGYIKIQDKSIVRLLYALSTASKLVSLSLAGWSFKIKDPAIFARVDEFMRSSHLQELNLATCRFRVQMKLPQTSPCGNSCASLVTHMAASQTNQKTRGKHFAQLCSGFRPFLPSADVPDASTSAADAGASSLDVTHANIAKEATMAGSEGFTSNLKEKGNWPNLVKLSLTEAIGLFKDEEEEEVEVIGGPDIFILLDKLRNLTELSVSVHPTAKESATPVSPTPALTDASSKHFFRAIQKQLGRKLERLCMSFSIISWQHPSQTASNIARRLLRCEKLIELELNFVQFCVVEDVPGATALKVNQQPHPADQGEPVHWLLYAIVNGCPRLEELSVIGMKLTLTQAYNLGMLIRDRWKGDTLRMHVWCTGEDEHQTMEIIYNLLNVLKADDKLEADYIGGYRGTITIRRRKRMFNFISRINDIKTVFPKVKPIFASSKDLFQQRTSQSGDFGDAEMKEQILRYRIAIKEANDNMETLCSSLPPTLRSLFGLTPFDYSIMQTHFWNSNERF